jgi:hypothetical protein
LRDQKKAAEKEKIRLAKEAEDREYQEFLKKRSQLNSILGGL